MKCPKCDYSNPTGATHCALCSEVFNKSAADRYLHAQRRAIREEGRESPTPEPVRQEETAHVPITRILKETAARIDWRPQLAKIWNAIHTRLVTHTREIAIASGVIALAIATLFFTSPAQRLQLFGRHMDYRINSRTPPIYFISIHSEVKRWSERGNRLDTPLGYFQRDELGNLKLTASGSPRRIEKVVVQAREWIVTQAGQMPQNIPLSHPSLQPALITLDGRGHIHARALRGSFRTGRTGPFVMPDWPSRNLRTGAEWDEPVEWIAAYGDWKISWRGRLHWKLEGITSINGAPCLYLKYRAFVAPSLWENPEWANHLVRRISFTGTGTGEAFFDTRARQLYSNDFLQEGALSIPIDDIYHIPREVRVGRTPRQRYGHKAVREPGVLIFQIKDKLDVRKS